MLCDTKLCDTTLCQLQRYDIILIWQRKKQKKLSEVSMRVLKL